MEGFEIYIIIFSVQIFRYALTTLRFALMARGEKIVNTMISFVLSISYILLVAKVFANLTTDPWQAVSYVLGSVVGTYIGMVFDEVSGLGQDILTVIVDIEKGNKLIDDIHYFRYCYRSSTDCCRYICKTPRFYESECKRKCQIECR